MLHLNGITSALFTFRSDMNFLKHADYVVQISNNFSQYYTALLQPEISILLFNCYLQSMAH